MASGQLENQKNLQSGGGIAKSKAPVGDPVQGLLQECPGIALDSFFFM
jgi:hypothetical protein